MNENEQRIAIAKACNWPQPNYWDDTIWMSDPNGRETSYGRMSEVDPLRSLDAMHEAEKLLTNDQWSAYSAALWRITNRPPARYECHATATQRAEAFLRTLNLWKE